MCKSKPDLFGDVEGVCGVTGKGILNSFGVRLAETGCEVSLFGGDTEPDFKKSLVSEENLTVEGKTGKSARGMSGTDSPAFI